MKAGERHSAFRDTWLFLWHKLHDCRAIFLGGILFSLSQTMIMMLEPLFVNLFFNHLEVQAYRKVAVLIVTGTIVMLLLVAGSLLGEYWKKSSMAKLNTDVMAELADAAHLGRFDELNRFHSSDIVQRIAYDSQRVTGLLMIMLDRMLDQSVMLILGAVYLLWLNWQIALAVLVISPLMLLVSHALRHRLETISQVIARQEAAIRKIQQETMQSIESVKMFQLEHWALNRFVAERMELNRLYLKRTWYYQIISITTTSMSNLMILACVLVVGWMAIRHTMALGSLLVFFTLIWRVTSPLQAIGMLWGQAKESIGVTRRIFDLLQIEKETAASGEPASPAEQNRMMLRFSDVGYDCPASVAEGAVKGLEDVSLEIEPGLYVSFVGPSGAGKSTIAKLAAGLIVPSRGNVSLNGLDSARQTEEYRKHVAYVPQASILFSGTVRDNLMIVRPQAGEEELLEALRISQALDFVNALPDGLDTRLRELGQSLSGGQIQRLSIARAILSQRPVLILDEATSALDYETERRVIRGLREYANAKGLTILFITHRLATIEDADRIYVVDKGRIVAEGTHDELMDLPSSVYRDLWMQATSF